MTMDITIDKEFQSYLRPLTAEEFDGLSQDIQANGCREPLVIWQNGKAVLLDGHNRLDVCRKHHVKYEVREIALGSRQEALLWICDNQLNKRNLNTNERSYYQGKRYELQKAQHGALKGNANAKKQSGHSDHSVSTSGKTAKARATQEGVSEKTVRRNAEFMKAVEMLEEVSPGSKANVLAGGMTKKEVMRLYRQALPKPKIPLKPQAATSRQLSVVQDFYTVEGYKQLSPTQRAAVLGAKPHGTFNQQKTDSIEWAQWSWNPVTGCLHNCPYCYARDIAQDLYPTKFKPAIWPKKIALPQVMTPPARAKQEVGYKNVFVCSMADLFGKWVPTAWIEAVLGECRQATEWNFLFLTKFPSRLVEFTFGDNMWVGTTVDCQARVKEAEKAFRRVKAAVKWLSCEPLIEPLHFTSLEMFDWLVVGGASPSSETPAYIPPTEWLGRLYVEASKHGLKVYEKTNGRPREYPGFRYDTAPESMGYLPSK